MIYGGESVSHLVISDSLWPHGLQPARLLCPWDSAGKNTGLGCHVLLQGLFLTQGSNLGLLHCRWILYCLSHQGSPWYMERALQKPYRCIRFFIWENWTFQFLREIRTKTEGKRITEIEKRSWLFFITSRNIRTWIKCEQKLWQVFFS